MRFSRKLTSYLDEWFSEKKRKPLIIRGARQVGKTFLVRDWAKQNSKTLAYINLERASHRQLFQVLERGEIGIDLNDCIRVISDNFIEGDANLEEALIFFDEIQNVPKLIPLLRFFYEMRPELAVIAQAHTLN